MDRMKPCQVDSFVLKIRAEITAIEGRLEVLRRLAATLEEHLSKEKGRACGTRFNESAGK
jgi:hypothetical protein